SYPPAKLRQRFPPVSPPAAWRMPEPGGIMSVQHRNAGDCELSQLATLIFDSAKGSFFQFNEATNETRLKPDCARAEAAIANALAQFTELLIPFGDAASKAVGYAESAAVCDEAATLVNWYARMIPDARCNGDKLVGQALHDDTHCESLARATE